MSVTHACPKRRTPYSVLVALVLAWPLLAAAQVPPRDNTHVTSGVKRLQHQQQRDSNLRQQSITERQRQANTAMQRRGPDNSGLQRQLHDSDNAQHQRYRQRRQQTIRKHPDLPPPVDRSSPQAPASARSSG